jgi:glucosylceramidase
MKHYLHTALIIGLSLFFYGHVSGQKVEIWLTTSDKSHLLQQQADLKFTSRKAKGGTVITVEPDKKYQSIDGFGFALTAGSAIHLKEMSAGARAELLRELFLPGSNGIGISYLRISIAASDLNDHAFSYDDVPPGETDLSLSGFSLGPDLDNVIPILKEILTVNPNIKILASPWSAPAWMKTNNDTRGGSLKSEYFDVYARYFVRYIDEMAKLGIKIDAVTVQNEPLHPGNNPSMLMLPEDQAAFIAKSLGPAFKAAALTTKIIIYDHNPDRPDYPLTVLKNKDAAQYVDGSAFHLYGGSIDTLTYVHNMHPDKNLYFTEQWVGYPGHFKSDISTHINDVLIGSVRNWCKNVIEWNLTSNPANTPHTDRGGCDRCLGGVTIDGDRVTRNPGYYVVGHVGRFVAPNSIRIESNRTKSLNNVAFTTPDGKTVLLVINNDEAAQTFGISYRKKNCSVTLPANAVATLVW